MSVQHPLVASSVQTCYGCPDQYEGKLIDGRWFYFRYRHGWASLAVSDDYNEVVGRSDVGVAVGDGLQGVFEDAEQRDRIFAELLTRAAAR